MNILLIIFEFPPQPGGIGTYSYQIAQIASSNNVNQFLLVSSVGADSESIFFYNQVKGELEDEVKEALEKRRKQGEVIRIAEILEEKKADKDKDEDEDKEALSPQAE